MRTLQVVLATIVITVQPPSANATDIQKGRIGFIRCMACHTLKPGEPHKVGPNLRKVISARAASADGYLYSDGMRTSGVTWDEQTLRRFITHPPTVVPGTSMAYVNTLSETEIDNLIAFLKTETTSP
jgi:cytochrome c